ncbi:MAG: rhodanese-like domain-containing protein [Tissierellia bacterium]|nr:rhodanese-like domain-containing protein [Tissierellia bacterium]
MKKGFKGFIALLLVLAIISPTMIASAEEAVGVKIQRISGSNRYETALEVADVLDAQAKKVILASGENFPDALAGSILTEGKYPILLTQKNGLDDKTKEKLLAADEVILLGGKETISEAVEASLVDDNTKLRRIAGDDRYETAAKIATEVEAKGYLLTNGEKFPDAVSGGGYALMKDLPILLTKPMELPKATADAIAGDGIENVTLLGGETSIAKDVEESIQKPKSRLSGMNRYQTSLQIAREFENPKTLILATGENFPDALTASALSGKLNAPVILVQGDVVNEDLKTYLHDIRIGLEEVLIVGGESSVSSAFAEHLGEMLQSQSRTVSANQLEAWIKGNSVKIFDLRNAEDFAKGHIPGALNINNKEFEDPDNAIPAEIATPEQFEALMSSYGITAEDTIVVYSDAKRPQMAPRLIWTFEVYGHNNTYILDGHYKEWVAAGKEVETGAAKAPTPSTYTIQSTNSAINVGSDAVINRGKDTVVVDCRPVEEYTGDTLSTSNAKSGHIPGAVNMPYMSTVTEDGFYKDPAVLKAMYDQIGATKDKEIIVYCQSAHRAAHGWFVLRHVMGYENVKVYDGSMWEWGNRPDLPIAIGPYPYNRTTTPIHLEAWMKAGIVKVFDLRSQEDYEKGHIPGAMNINNKEFEDPDNPIDGEIATPAQFEALMSAYGITPEDMIVVYSDAAKPQMAPRLIWTLEVYGHTNTYVLDGHYQSWVAEGKEIETGPSAVPTPSAYKITKTNNAINVDSDYVINRSKDAVLIDCRPVEDYTGEKISTSNAKSGHIPGAVNMYYMNTVTEDGFFKSREDLEALYKTIGATEDKEIIIYCQRAHRASHSWFVLSQILGYEKVKIYDGSMMEWGNRDDLPVVTGANPY